MWGEHIEALETALIPVFVRGTSAPMFITNLKRGGIDALRRGDPAAAIRALREVVHVDRSDAVALGYLGIAYVCLQDFDHGIPCLKSAIRLDPGSAPLQYNLGMALEKSGRVSEAVGLYQHALLLDPTYEQAERALQRLAAAGDQPEAVAEPAEKWQPQADAAIPPIDSSRKVSAEDLPEPPPPKAPSAPAGGPSPAAKATLRAAAMAINADSAEAKPAGRVDWPFIGACGAACVGLLWLVLQATGPSLRAGSSAPTARAPLSDLRISSVADKPSTDDVDSSLAAIRNPALEREMSAVAAVEKRLPTAQDTHLPRRGLATQVQRTADARNATGVEGYLKAAQLLPRVQQAASEADACAERARRYHEFAELYARQNPSSPALKQQLRAAAHLDAQAKHARAVRDQERRQLAEAYIREHQETEAIRQLLEIRDGRDADAAARVAAARRLQEIAAAAR